MSRVCHGFPIIGQEKAHKLWTRKLFESRDNPGTTCGLTRGRKVYMFPVFRGEHINFLARLTLGQPAVCPRAISTLTRAKIRSRSGKPNQRKVSSWTFRGGKFEPKFDVNCACSPKEKHRIHKKKAKIRELFVGAPFSVWFAGATPEKSLCLYGFFLPDSISCEIPSRKRFGDKFGESLGGSQAPPSFPGSFRASPEVPRTSPEVFRRLPQKFSHCGTQQ